MKYLASESFEMGLSFQRRFCREPHILHEFKTKSLLLRVSWFCCSVCSGPPGAVEVEIQHQPPAAELEAVDEGGWWWSGEGKGGGVLCFVPVISVLTEGGQDSGYNCLTMTCLSVHSAADLSLEGLSCLTWKCELCTHLLWCCFLFCWVLSAVLTALNGLLQPCQSLPSSLGS